jgi:hypothetical protein
VHLCLFHGAFLSLWWPPPSPPPTVSSWHPLHPL